MPGNVAQHYASVIISTEWRENVGVISGRGKEWIAYNALIVDCLERVMKPFYHVRISLK